MFKHIYHRVLQLGSENISNDNSYSEAQPVNEEDKVISQEDELVDEELVAEATSESFKDEPAVLAKKQEPQIEEDPDDQRLYLKEESDDDFDDEIGQPFDLEEEDIDNPRKARGKAPKRALIESAKEFFNTEFIYRYDILEDQDRKAKTGKYRFELKGFQGGIWSIDLGEKMDVVNRREDAEIVFTMQQKDFVHVVNGDVNPQLAILAKKLRITGDMRKAINFLDLLVPGGD